MGALCSVFHVFPSGLIFFQTSYESDLPNNPSMFVSFFPEKLGPKGFLEFILLPILLELQSTRHLLQPCCIDGGSVAITFAFRSLKSRLANEWPFDPSTCQIIKQNSPRESSNERPASLGMSSSNIHMAMIYSVSALYGCPASRTNTTVYRICDCVGYPNVGIQSLWLS